MKRCQEKDRGAEGVEGGGGNIFHLGTQGSFLEKVSDQLPIYPLYLIQGMGFLTISLGRGPL